MSIIDMVTYIKPLISHVEADLVLLAASGPTAGDIGSPSVSTKSVWDEESDNILFNIKEEKENEDKVYE